MAAAGKPGEIRVRGPMVMWGLRRLVRERLGALYEPAFVDFVDRLPLTALSKVDNRACRRLPVTDPRARRWPGATAARSARPE
ncbi:hypothetical protein GCM10023214_04260 [Amycolatopsis dongchuanensis]|uniref:Uncharacterized protein n=1 Tax=Amycolatopsis dongchuanensis TaxID=1070866 RepID=A0ABP9PVT9_9PSEU